MADLSPVVRALPNELATSRLAAAIAARARRGDVIALSGPLGAGKTSFARAFIRARFGTAAEVPSPTFTLVEIYDGDGDGDGPPVWHFDLYRLDRAEEAWELGIEDAFAEGISLIEWPERLGTLLPTDRLAIDLAFPTLSARLRGERVRAGEVGAGGEDGDTDGNTPSAAALGPSLSPLRAERGERIATLTASATWAGRLDDV